MDREKVIKGLEQFKADLKPFCGNRADWERFDAGLALMKEQEEKMKHLNNITLEYEKEVFRLQAMLKEQEAVVRCKDCIEWDETTEECSNIDSVCFRNGRCRPDWFCADGEKAVK